MTFASDIATRAGKQPEPVELGTLASSVTETPSGAQQYTTLAPGALLQSAAPQQSNPALGADALSLLSERTPDGNYKHPRTFALRDGKRSFRYTLTRRNGATEQFIFESGLLTSVDGEFIDSITADLKRPLGISHTVMDITGKELAAQMSYAVKAGTRGNTGSDEMNLSKKRQEMAVAEQAEKTRIAQGQLAEEQARNAYLKQQLESLQAEKAARLAVIPDVAPVFPAKPLTSSGIAGIAGNAKAKEA